MLSGSEEMPRYTETNAISRLMLCFHIWATLGIFRENKRSLTADKSGMTRFKRKFLSNLGLLKAYSFSLLQAVSM